MEKYKYPNYECGDCPVWLGAKTMAEAIECCKKRHCDIFEEGIVECDGRCLNCDEFDPVRGCMVEER